MSFYVVLDNLVGLLADALPWFLGGAILGAALEAFLPTAWANAGSSSPRASILHATLAGAILPGCSMTTVPLAAALKTRGARLGTLTAFIMISPILSPETIILTAALLGAKFTIARIVFPVVVTVLMGLALMPCKHGESGNFNCLPVIPQALTSRWPAARMTRRSRASALSGPALRRCFIHSGFTFSLGLLAVAILQAVVPPQDIARYLHGGIGAYLLAAVAGIPLYVCEGAEVPLTYGLLQAGVGIGPAFTFMLGAVGTCIPTILMAPRIIGKTSTYVYVAVWLLLAIGGGWALSVL